jgi:hypothetical protein
MTATKHRAFKQPHGYLDKGSASYKKLHEVKFIQNWYRELSDIEPQALDLVRPFQPADIQPVIRKAVTQSERAIMNYFRVMLSSEDQNYRVKPRGRGAEYLLFDGKSGGFLGLWAMVDAELPYRPISEWAGGKVGINCIREGFDTARMVTNLKRCLPLWDFGPLTGGKLIALLATSTEMLQAHELQYSLDVAAVMIKTTHGKSSQYNRLHPRGIAYIGEAPDGAGLYLLQARQFSKEVMTGRATDAGKRLTFKLGDQVAYWKERWLPNRMGLTTGGWITPDPNRYRLSNVIRERIEKRIVNERAAGKGPQHETREEVEA